MAVVILCVSLSGCFVHLEVHCESFCFESLRVDMCLFLTLKMTLIISEEIWSITSLLLFQQVRLHSVPLGSAESLRFSYKSALSHLVQGYTSYLHRNIQETPASRKPRARIVSRPENTNISCSSHHISNNSLVNFKDTITPNITAGNRRRCKANTPSGDFGSKATNRSKVTVGVNRETLNDSIGYEDIQGLLVIEPWRNVSHDVQHHPCKSPAIQQALVTRIINAQDLERNRNFFLYPEKVLLSFLRQSDDFELKTD